jgi:hypothetical protein
MLNSLERHLHEDEELVKTMLTASLWRYGVLLGTLLALVAIGFGILVLGW